MKRYIIGKIVEKDGEKVLDGVTMNKGYGIIGTGIFIAGMVTVFNKGKEVAKKISTKLNIDNTIKKIKMKINI